MEEEGRLLLEELDKRTCQVEQSQLLRGLYFKQMLTAQLVHPASTVECKSVEELRRLIEQHELNIRQFQTFCRVMREQQKLKN